MESDDGSGLEDLPFGTPTVQYTTGFPVLLSGVHCPADVVD
jgi:hypothetical protein